jgi:hypothetical protein
METLGLHQRSGRSRNSSAGLLPPRVLLTISLETVVAGHLGLEYVQSVTDCRHVALAQPFEGLGYGRTRTIAHPASLLPQRRGNFRIALIATMSEHRRELHQTNVGAAIASNSQQLGARGGDLTNYLVTKGFTRPAPRTPHGISTPGTATPIDCFRIIA